MDQGEVIDLLEQALRARSVLFETPEGKRHEAALRLFNGFLEGLPDLVVDLYAQTLVIYDYAGYAAGSHPEDESQPGAAGRLTVEEAVRFFTQKLPWIQAVLMKTRNDPDEQSRRGRVVFGERLDRRIRENGIWYAIDLSLNLDASLYLDTRGLRGWARDMLAGKRVLNTFAYTGSLGVAAVAGGAREVIQTDLNRRFLNLAKDSYALNGFPVHRADFRSGDFWVQTSQLTRAGELFDCVFVDPPFFSVTERGTVDLIANSQRVINKVRPLVGDGGWLVAINNALFFSGAEYWRLLEELCRDGYLSIEGTIPVQADFTGYPQTRVGDPPVNPAPFNHTTKIAILRVQRKDGRRADLI
jgi:23S rRNA (cytosine1962-C5)-methyltransferase